MMTCQLNSARCGIAIGNRDEQQAADSQNPGKLGQTSAGIGYIFQHARTQDPVRGAIVQREPGNRIYGGEFKAMRTAVGAD